MANTFFMSERALSTDPDAEKTGMRDAEPDYALADAEEEEYAELWASDPGNQGA